MKTILPLKIEHEIDFMFADKRNADAVALALASGGHFVNMKIINGFFSVEVYKRFSPKKNK